MSDDEYEYALEIIDVTLSLFASAPDKLFNTRHDVVRVRIRKPCVYYTNCFFFIQPFLSLALTLLPLIEVPQTNHYSSPQFGEALKNFQPSMCRGQPGLVDHIKTAGTLVRLSNDANRADTAFVLLAFTLGIRGAPNTD